MQDTELEKQHKEAFTLERMLKFLGSENDVDRTYIEGTPMFEYEMVAIYEKLQFTRETTLIRP